MKKIIIASIAVVLSALIMLGIQLQFNGCQLADIDIQRLVVESLTLDVTMYLAYFYTKKMQDDILVK